MKKLYNVPSLKGLLPFVRATYPNPTNYVWEDEAGVRHRILQAEGGEQGDPLMPLSVQFGDPRPIGRGTEGLWATRTPSRPSGVRHFGCARPYADIVRQLGNKVARTSGDSLAHWKDKASLCPEGVAELGPEVWNPEGVKILGTPVGSQRFVQEVVEKRLAEEQRLWDAVPKVPDLQAAWQILLQCAGPRCHHVLRTLPPSQSEV